MKMTSRFIAIFLFVVSISAQAQVGINSTGANPDNSAMLDVSAANKGVLIPRVALTGINDVTTVTSPATSLLVFNTATAGDVTPGFYYYNGAAWTRIVSGIQAETDPVFTSAIDVSGSLTGDLLKYDGTKYVKFTPNFTESNFLYNSRYGVKLLARNDAQTDVDFVISPKGNGAIIAQQPDGTATGGNIRGIKALDLQMIRSSATQVASGNYSTISGGRNNTAGGMYSLVSGHYNTAQSYGETVIGIFATIGDGDPDEPNSDDRLFVIGNGSSPYNRRDALNILKDGSTALGGSLTINGNGTGTSFTLPATRGTNGNVLTTDGIGGTSWTTPASSQWTTNGSNIYYNTGYVGIGVTTPYAPLQFDNSLVNRKLVLWSTLNNDHQYYGFGVNASALRYQVQSTSDSHVFYAGTSTTTSTELFRIKGTGQIVIPALTIKGVLLNNALGEVSSTIGTNGQVLTTNSSGGVSWTTPAVGTVTGVTGTAPIVSSGGVTPAISISAATTSAAGSMSAADKAELDAATNANTASTLVARDASGNFTAGTITAALTGNATSATTSTNIAGGLAGSVPYQTAANATTLLAKGTAGQVLTMNSGATAPQWSTPTTGTVTGVTGTLPISVATGTTTPVVSIAAATFSAAGSMSAADKTKLDAITGTNTGNQTITLTGDVTGSGTGSFVTTISAGAVSNTELANMAANTIKVNNTTLAAVPTDLSLTANTFPSRKSTGNITANPITDFAFDILNDPNAAAIRTTIGAGTGNGTVTEVTGSAPIIVANGTTTPAIIILPASTSAAGSMSAADKTKLDGSTHAIGDSYGGGVVFYVYDNGQHGLIAATADQSTGIQWDNGTYTTTNAVRDGIGAGKFNTERIIAN